MNLKGKCSLLNSLLFDTSLVIMNEFTILNITLYIFWAEKPPNTSSGDISPLSSILF